MSVERRRPGSALDEVAVAIVGPGAIGDCHARAIRAVGGRLVAIAGPKPSENAEFAEAHAVDGARVFTDPAELFAAEGIDAVVIASPSGLHADQTIQALNAGKHVLCEIPVGLDYRAAAAVARTAAAACRCATVGHTLRYWAPYVELAERVTSGEIVVTHVIGRSLQLRQSNVGWTGRTRDWTDSVLWHHGAHLVDSALWLLSDPNPVVAGFIGPPWPRSDAPMDVTIALQSHSLALASLTLSYHSRIAISDLVVVGEDATFEIRDGRLLGPKGTIVDSDGVGATQQAAIEAQDREFLSAIAESRAPRFTIADALPAMRVLQELQDLAEAHPVL